MAPLFTSGETPPFTRLEPGPETDAIWLGAALIHFIPLSEDEVLKAGQDPKTAAKFPPNYHPSIDSNTSYVGGLDVFHKIHCLDELRRSAFENYYGLPEDGELPKHSKRYWQHRAHCLGTLYKAIACNTGANVITSRWISSRSTPFPDFGNGDDCTDYEAIKRWIEKHSFSETPVRPEGWELSFVPDRDP